MARKLKLGAALLASALVVGCSGGGGLTTASLLGTPAKAPVDERSDRALNTAAISARASKCGYNFNPGRLRESFLASEAASGATPEEMGKLSQSYDFTLTTVSKQISKPDEYCTEQRTREVSNALQKQLAGDFRAPKRAPVSAASWWGEATQKPMDREAIFDPMAPK